MLVTDEVESRWLIDKKKSTRSEGGQYEYGQKWEKEKESEQDHLFSLPQRHERCINRLEERLRAAILFHSVDRKVSNDEELFIALSSDTWRF